MAELVLVVNPGSSSREYAIYDRHRCLMRGYYEKFDEKVILNLQSAGGESEMGFNLDVFDVALANFLDISKKHIGFSDDDILGVGVRLVAPGRFFMQHRKIAPDTLVVLEEQKSRAPLHIGVVIDEIKQVNSLIPAKDCYLISDSAFHSTLTHEARNYAIDRKLADSCDIYRYGYHGISVESIVGELRDVEGLNYQRVIVCHLGSGASLTAVKNWQSIENSMGYSPLEGLVMSTRSGNIDIEAALELKKSQNFTDQQLIDYLNQQAGLKGLSMQSNDVRVLLELESKGDENARFALDMMVYRIRFYIGAYAAVLGGLDAIVFSATIGERSAPIRSRVCEGLDYLGVALDKDLNRRLSETNAVISHPSSRVMIHEIVSDETGQIAQLTFEQIRKNT